MLISSEFASIASMTAVPFASADPSPWAASTWHRSSGTRLVGNGQDNLLRGTNAADVLMGRGGQDTLKGMAGADRLFGDSGDDRLFGNAGNDRLSAGSGRDRLDAGSGADVLIGSDRDVLIGSLGNDSLISSGANNTLTGNAGIDRFVVTRRAVGSQFAATTRITDFADGEDQLQFADITTIDQLLIRQGSGTLAADTIIQSNATGEYLAVLNGVNSSTIDGADFGFATSNPDPDPTPNPTPDPTPGTGALSIEQATYRVAEGAGQAVITVVRSGGSSGSVTVNYSTSGNTASAGDYTSTSGKLTFNAGETRKTFAVPIVQDTAFESAEVLNLTLSEPGNGGTLGSRTSALLTITNDDNPTQAQIQSKAATSLTIGNSTLYIGYNQVSTGSNGNQDPWAARFTNGSLTWYHDDYEFTQDDSRGTHLVWDGGNVLYAAFTSTGTQGTPAEDFRRFATGGWLRTYSDYSPGGGGGARVAVLAKLNPLTGDVTKASFLTALNGTKTNSVFVKTLSLSGDRLVVAADSAFAPRRADRTAMTSNGQPSASPNYTVEFNSDLTGVISVSSVNYSP